MTRSTHLSLAIVAARVVLAVVALACLLLPVPYSRYVTTDAALSWSAHGPVHHDTDRHVTVKTFWDVVDEDADEAWNLLPPIAILGIVAWEVASHRSARRAAVARAPSGARARLFLLLSTYAWVIVASFELNLDFSGKRSAAFAQYPLRVAAIMALIGAVYDVVVTQRRGFELQRTATG